MKKILIANRGEIARRIQRTCREMGIGCVAVFSEPDRQALYVHEADEAVALCGATPAESYLRVDALLDAALRTGCDAVHPGYGFLAENAEFARHVVDGGLKFIGPTWEAIEAMGSKIEAKRRMQAAGVPVLPSVDVGMRTPDELRAELKPLGWPLLVKASLGGGGRGMRIVHRADALEEALETARREAQNAFGNGSLFIEPYVENSRHIEIQIFGDEHGHVVHLFERECSIQRRHQKIIEESPSPVVDEPLRTAMCEAAVAAGRAIGYVNAGTVEFMVTPDQRFYFLEVNTRLQVEHPVTECLTGLDLVRLQIEVARGKPLPPEALTPRRQGHAIEVRLYAEDPARDFLPVTGRLHRFAVPCLPGLRVDTGVVDGSDVSPYYDSMLAKLIVHAPTRDEAAARLVCALRGSQIHGLQTNRELLVRILEHPEFLAGQTDTHFLKRHDPVALAAPLADVEATKLHAVAAALAAQAGRREAAGVLRSVPSGWRNNPSQLQPAGYTSSFGPISVGYRFTRSGVGVEVDGRPLGNVRLHECRPERVDLEIDSVRRAYHIHRVGQQAFVDSALGSNELTECDRFPRTADDVAGGSLVAPLPGVVDELSVSVGQHVEIGDVLVVIESMKMLHKVTAPRAGRVAKIHVQAKAHVEAGAVLAVIEESDA